MLDNWNLSTRMFLSFVFMGAIVFLVALVGWYGNKQLVDTIQIITNNTLPGTVSIWKVNEGQTQIESSERALLDPSNSPVEREIELKRIDRAKQQIKEGFSTYSKKPKSAAELEIYQKLQDSWNEWESNHKEFLRIHEQFQNTGIVNPFEEQLSLLETGQENSAQMERARRASELLLKLRERAKVNRAAFERTNQLLLEIIKINETVAQQGEADAKKDVDRSRFLVFMGMFFGPLTAVMFGNYFSRTIAKPLGARIDRVVAVAERISAGDLSVEIDVTGSEKNETGKLLVAFKKMTKSLNALIGQVQQSGIQITTSSTQIAASGKQLEATMTEQVAATNEVVATAKEIAATSAQLLAAMQDVAGVSEETATAASQSQSELARMEATMRQLATATSSISGKLGTISEKANNINSVVTTIAKVADRTNLLSLNAAIEAEKAGEYGSGFAVVAREIRRLADQTAVATLEIEQMVKEMQSAVSTGVMEMDKFTKEVKNGVEDVRTISQQLALIIDQVKALTPSFEDVNQGMEAQSTGAGQISSAMVQLSEQAAQTAETLAETNRALEQLNDAAQGLRRAVSRFTIKSK
ncbi:MAG TPA: methyl-accepting chemotaxis protein [Oscillatoriaceae cyanobacterium M33_DOE_052]|uniref:Methyl-accepting chemotaxis protein n=1 Tax=Planktothricoides sp. SpSt-374 TaxID=2282167 RepID=A0A7C3VF37_9CYAN|nr:methyl-accepting chemotaxis protein [Oscillatoriaceae cyanobacterium M33_DOE_052]